MRAFSELRVFRPEGSPSHTFVSSLSAAMITGVGRGPWLPLTGGSSLLPCHIPTSYPVLQFVGWKNESMKRTFIVIVAALAAVAMFVGLVHAVLVVAHVSEPATTTVYGLTPRRLWATTAAALALTGVVVGSLALVRPSGRLGTSGRLGVVTHSVSNCLTSWPRPAPSAARTQNSR